MWVNALPLGKPQLRVRKKSTLHFTVTFCGWSMLNIPRFSLDLKMGIHMKMNGI